MIQSCSRLTKIPTDELLKIKTLKKLDLRFNKLTQFDPDFIEQIKLGLDVEYEGESLRLPESSVLMVELLCL